MKKSNIMILVALAGVLGGCHDSNPQQNIQKAINDKVKQIQTGANQMKEQMGKSLLGNQESVKATITFTPNSSTLSPQAFDFLQAIIRFQKQHPSAKITIMGFTDKTGNDTINIPLSIKRAEAVKQYLVNNGCNNIQDIGYGSSTDDRKVIVTAQ